METVTKDLTLAVLKNFWGLWESVKPAETLPLAQVYHFQDRTRYVTGIPLYTCNGIIKTRMTPQHTVEGIRKEIQFFQKLNLPFAWWVDPTTVPANFGEILEAQGLHLAETQFGFAKEMKELSPRIQRRSKLNLKIEQVRSKDQLRQFGDILGKWKNISLQASEGYTNLLLVFGLDGPFKHYMAFLDDVPAGTASLLTTGDVAGFWHGTVLPEHQGKGIGTSLVTHLYMEAQKNGARKMVALLPDQALVQNIYKRLGFAEQFPIQLFK